MKMAWHYANYHFTEFCALQKGLQLNFIMTTRCVRSTLRYKIPVTARLLDCQDHVTEGSTKVILDVESTASASQHNHKIFIMTIQCQIVISDVESMALATQRNHQIFIMTIQCQMFILDVTSTASASQHNHKIFIMTIHCQMFITIKTKTVLGASIPNKNFQNKVVSCLLYIKLKLVSW